MTRYVTPYPLPTPYERELLTILIEECAEVQQRATKLLRFGRDEIQPGQYFNNSFRLALELGDLKAMVNLVIVARLVQQEAIEEGALRKRKQLAAFMQTDDDTSPLPQDERADG